MLDLAKHIVNQKAADFDPEKFEDHYKEALTELINAKRQGKTIGPKPRPRGENVVDLMDALKKSIASETAAKGKKPRKASAGQKEMLLPIEGKKPAKKAAEPAMCEKCKELDQKIEHYRELSQSATDQPTIDRFKELIRDLYEQKIALHARPAEPKK